MITDKDVADKKNEVTILRLERDEMLIRRQLDRAKKDSDQHKQICEYCETIGALRSTIGELEERDTLKTTAIDELQKTIEEMKLKVEPPNLAVMGLLHNLNAKTEALEADLSNSKSAIMMKNGVINEKNTLIDELNETISDLRMAASDMLDTTNECARGEAEDSRVLMQVVEAVKIWKEYRYTQSISQIATIVEDYLAAPESPVVTLETPSIGTRVVSKNEETHTIDEAKMEAVRMLVGSDMWVLHTDEEAVEDKQQKETIDELTETTRKLKGRLSSMYAANSDQDTTINKLNALLAGEKMTLAAYRSNPLSDQVADRDDRIEQLMVLNEALRIDIDGQDKHIEALKSTVDFGQSRIDLLVEKKSNCIDELMKDLDARNQVIKDFKAIEQKETDRLHETIEGNGKIIDELNDMYCDVCGKLEQIEKVTKDAISYVHIDEITKIIQEE